MSDASNDPKRGLNLLGRAIEAIPARPDLAVLETFPNRYPQRSYWIRFETVDFTSLCPVTGQPDFARITIDYVADERCIETKSLKFYLASFRNSRSFNEEVVNRILDDLVAACAPRRMIVHGAFASRGGISLSAQAAHPDEAAHRLEPPARSRG
ncbi:MAG TPA: preQ(1) synthase [Chthoniobacteraceae bacterium]|nr:preQ(1) synthase [Chthoniobacteraceae bacterium]